MADAADGRLDEHSLLHAALIASGVEDPALAAIYERRVEELVIRLGESLPIGVPPRQRAEAVLTLLHAELLAAGYDAECTALAEVFDTGRFNCVSSAVLFCCLAEPLGLEVAAAELPGHLFVRLRDDGGWLEVETTCPRWFALVDRVREELWRARTGRPGAALGESRAVGKCGLVAAIYYNRGFEALEQGRYAEAVAANAKAQLLDPESPTARGNLLAAINNWALHLAACGEYDQALRLLSEGERLAPNHETFRLNRAALLKAGQVPD